MLRWIWEVTKIDRIRNERYGIEAPKVGDIAMEVQDKMRNWYGHMVRREEHCMRRKNDDGNIRKRGIPKIRWLDRVRGDIKEKGLSGRVSTTELHISSNIDSQKMGPR